MTSMATKMVRGLTYLAVVLIVLAAVIWILPSPERRTDKPGQDRGTDVEVRPSDGEADNPTETAEATTPDAENTSEPAGNHTDAEEVARAFMTTYPGDVQPLGDPTFLASLDGVDITLLEQVTDFSLEPVDQATDEDYEQYAFTVSGTYRGERVPLYSIVVARPAEPGEGGSSAENDLSFQVQSFDWAPNMLDHENAPGSAVGKPAPLSAEQRGDLISQTRNDVIASILTVDPSESTEQRQARLDELMVEPTAVTPPMSRSGRYAMTTEILSQAYSTDPGGPIAITYAGTWVDPYDPTYNGSWSLTATITKEDDGRFHVHSVEETIPNESDDGELKHRPVSASTALAPSILIIAQT